jgi:ATP-dependent exoDNAse (exonuclease V) beta subunit
MPEGTVLSALPAQALCVEMEFHFELAPVAVPTLLALLHAHGLLPERRGFGLRARSEGLLNGRIDLVYAADGRYYVLDYKSNQLSDYGAEAIARAVRDSEYDLQYLLYTLALQPLAALPPRRRLRPWPRSWAACVTCSAAAWIPMPAAPRRACTHCGFPMR